MNMAACSRFQYRLIALLCTCSMNVMTTWNTGDEDCEQVDHVTLPQIPLDTLKDLYHSRFGYAPKVEPVDRNNSVIISVASMLMTDAYNTGMLCGVHEDRTEKKDERDMVELISPWVVYVKTTQHICAGVLISDSWVLTSSVCTDITSSVFLGSSNIKQGTPWMQHLDSVEAVIHEDFNVNTHGKDIGLVKMVSPVKFSKKIRPICLPGPNASFEPFNCYLANWGRYEAAKGELSDDLHVISVSVLDQYECHFRWILAGEKVTEEEICIQFSRDLLENEKCSGDSGGPVICDVNGEFYVAGISGFVEGGCTNRFLPDRFTSTSYLQEWIIDKVMTWDLIK